MDNKSLLEGRLREAACVGDTDTVEELINLGVDINTRHSVNGWTPLHWACKRGNLGVAVLLLENGAERNVKSESGETPASLCTNPQLLQLLYPTMDTQHNKNEGSIHNFVSSHLIKEFQGTTMDTSYESELVLKIRIADMHDPDFIEVEIPRNNLSYSNLIEVCSRELNLKANQIVKIRKLPNTKLRKDKDVQRLKDFQEVEVVVSDPSKSLQRTTCSNGVIHSQPIMPTNVYQSISKKDQTILY